MTAHQPTDFDIETLFTPDITPPDFDNENQVSQMDIDEAISQALAEIDQHGPLDTDNTHPHNEKKEEEKQSILAEQEGLDVDEEEMEYTRQSVNFTQSLKDANPHYSLSFETGLLNSGKPLSPQSLRSDESEINSPNGSAIMTAQELIMSQEYEQLKSEMKKVQQQCDRKKRDLNIAMGELKNSERKRLALMEENRALKDALAEATMNIY